jgi:DNA-binding NtrC family response regulator
LCAWFIRKYGLTFGKEVQGIASEGLKLLQRCSWPGNVRQLENVVERMVIKAKGPRIGLSIVLESLKSEDGCPSVGWTSSHATDRAVEASLSEAIVPLNLSLLEMEKLLIEKVVSELNGNRNAAASHLGIGRTTLWRKMKA